MVKMLHLNSSLTWDGFILEAASATDHFWKLRGFFIVIAYKVRMERYQLYEKMYWNLYTIVWVFNFGKVYKFPHLYKFTPLSIST